MYKVFNMGHRFEFYCKPQDAQAIIEIAQSFNIPAKIVGRVESSASSGGKKQLTLTTTNGEFTYAE